MQRREVRTPAAVLDVSGAGVFAAGGEVGADLARVDWRATPLGPPSQWPTSLVSTVRVVLSSRFSMWMAWGEQLTFFCNDAYRRDTLAGKYPWALGRPASEVWAEIWPDIGPRIEHVMATGEATWDEALQLFLERSGYREESYHTFSYSPLTDDDGIVSGMLCVVSEDTERVIGAQRMAVVRDLGAGVNALRSEAEVLAAASRQLEAGRPLLPFTATYLLAPDGTSAVLAATTGGLAGHPVAPELVALDEAPPWVATVLDGGTAVVELPADDTLPTGGWEQPPLQALAVPFRQQDELRPTGWLLAAVNRHRPLDDDYRGFVELVAGQVGSSLASARAYQDERERAERLVELDRAKTAFFTNVSHEFRTPLTLLLGPAEDALADRVHPLPEVQRERLEIVRRNGERLLKLVNTLLDFSRLESGTLHAQFEAVDLAAYTGELARAFSAAVERVGLRLTVRCEPLPDPAWVDREMWAKVVLNLLSNALKFTFDGGIDVTLDAVDGTARLTVADTGTGIAVEHQDRLFERFTRVPGAASRSHEGSGIGLALVADLAAAHGGTVAVDSRPGAGSAFTVSVPLGRDHLPQDQVLDGTTAPGTAEADRSARGFLAEAMRWLGGRRSEQPEPAAPAGARPRVLVVDDNADMREYVARLLSADHEVLLAADGREGLETARREAPDLVLSDVMMPHLDGFGLLAALREDPLTAQVPVVLLSARAGEEATVEGLDAGADDYLAKPFSGRELLARVRANLELDRVRRTRNDLERSQQLLDQAQRLARVGSWELDLASGAISASEEFLRQVRLSAEELDDGGFERAFESRIHPDDRDRVRAALEAGTAGGPVDYEVRLQTPDGLTRTYRTLGELELDDEGRPVRLRGSNQDVTEQRDAEQVVASAAAVAEAAAREHRIADELQRSLLPAPDVGAEALVLAAYYRAGVEGTQVGGDWYDVVELGAGRTALVLGDVMGRGVRAAAVMGQLRAAVRAYARLDLAPADVLEHLDGVVRDLGDDQIVTCVYAVYDPYDRVLTWANAGHLPPLVRHADGGVTRLPAADGPPLGAGRGPLQDQQALLGTGDVLALFTDGLVENRHSDIDEGLASLSRFLGELATEVSSAVATALVEALLPDGPDDDVALLLVGVLPQEAMSSHRIPVPDDVASVRHVRHEAAATMRSWDVDDVTADEVLLMLSELVTNGLLHGRTPVEVRLRRGVRSLVLEVHDSASTLPRRMRPDDDDEHGRGLLMVSVLAHRWGTRPTPAGKAVWCAFDLPER